jgi:hypothetical protein
MKEVNDTDRAEGHRQSFGKGRANSILRTFWRADTGSNGRPPTMMRSTRQSKHSGPTPSLKHHPVIKANLLPGFL